MLEAHVGQIALEDGGGRVLDQILVVILEASREIDPYQRVLVRVRDGRDSVVQSGAHLLLPRLCDHEEKVKEEIHAPLRRHHGTHSLEGFLHDNLALFRREPSCDVEEELRA